ncbi:MAG: lactate racemase domain-containing protein [bacterium]
MQLIYGNTNVSIDSETLKSLISQAFHKVRCSKILLLPPDVTRLHSKSGEITKILYDILPGKKTIMPTIGTHEPLSNEHKKVMYHEIPSELFVVHDWRNDVVELGKIPSDLVHHISEGKLDYEIPIQINKILIKGGYDLIISIGQVVPHENTGFANHNKNIFIGIGGEETINKSHFLAAVYGMERIMGKINTPVREIFNYAEDNFLKGIHIIYIMTVIGRDEDNKLVMKGLFIGDDRETFHRAAELSQKVNITKLSEPLQKVVVYLDPIEYQSHWLGNKSIYRTRMALADNGELIVIAPGLKMYGEDAEIDRLIRKYGYHGTEEILSEVEENKDLKRNLVAAAHLIHGSSEGRFKITYAPGYLTKEETENAGYEWANINDLLKIYDPNKLKDGYNDGFYYISNPALGLWSI